MPEFDSREWRAMRDRKLAEWVGDPAAVQFITAFGGICEVWDDLIDRDKEISPDDINKAFWTALIEIPMNPFFERHKTALVPLLVTGINAWHDANELENGDDNDIVFAYVLRDWYMEFVSYVIFVCRGPSYLRSVSMEVRHFFTHHETLEKYRENIHERRRTIVS